MAVGDMSDTELLLKSKAEPVRRLEVFTGTGRRRAWSAEEKAAIIAESYGSGASVSGGARRHGLTPQQLFGWRRDARRRTAAGAEPAFAPVMVTAAESRSEGLGLSARSGGSGSLIEIAIGAVTVRVPRGSDAATLAMVLRAVAAVG